MLFISILVKLVSIKWGRKAGQGCWSIVVYGITALEKNSIIVQRKLGKMWSRLVIIKLSQNNLLIFGHRDKMVDSHSYIIFFIFNRNQLKIIYERKYNLSFLIILKFSNVLLALFLTLYLQAFIIVTFYRFIFQSQNSFKE